MPDEDSTISFFTQPLGVPNELKFFILLIDAPKQFLHQTGALFKVRVHAVIDFSKEFDRFVKFVTCAHFSPQMV